MNLTELIAAIDNSLINLRFLSLNTNFKLATERKLFFDKIIYVKQQYKQVECLFVNHSVSPIKIPAMRMYISRIIHPQQMEGWITKIQQNTSIFLNNPSIEKLNEQYVLLDIIIKVLNGDAYFSGCSHPPVTIKSEEIENV